MRWKVLLVAGIASGIALGVAAGIGGFTFVYAEGASYLVDDPESCANCHIMNEQYDGWSKSSHSSIATCNDCHTPHTFVGKWTTKALNGYHHSMAFTVGGFHEPIQITERNRRITEQACRDCHGEIVSMIDPESASPHAGSDSLSCLKCHQSVGHLH
ncbi:cytochrome c nitrite reductase small subunit [bacterium]|nr:cytochrome c nitrite reductase small subunit [bacterium]